MGVALSELTDWESMNWGTIEKMEFSQQDTAGSNCDSGPETDREDQPGPSKIPKITKTKGASKYRTKFNKAWITTFPFIHEVPSDAHSFTVLCADEM